MNRPMKQVKAVSLGEQTCSIIIMYFKRQVSYMETLKLFKATENTLKAQKMIIKKQLSCLGAKRWVENTKEDKCKQMRSSRQNDKLEQWAMHRAAKHEILESNLGIKKQC